VVRRFPIVVAIPVILLTVLVSFSILINIYYSDKIFHNRLEQSIKEASSLISLMQQTSEIYLARNQQADLVHVFNSAVSHDQLVNLQFITHEGLVFYSSSYEQKGEMVPVKELNRLMLLNSNTMELNKDKTQFTLTSPLRRLSGNLADHVGYIRAVFQSDSIYQQVAIEVKSNIYKMALFIFMLMVFLVFVLYFTVHKPLLSLRKSFEQISRNDFTMPMKNSLWSEFSALAIEGNNTRLKLALANKEEALLAKIFDISKGIYISDQDFKLKRGNQTFSSIIELDSQDYMNSHLGVHHLLDYSGEKALEAGQDWQVELSLDINGSQKYVKSSISRVYSASDVFYVGVLNDITQERNEADKREKAKDEFVASVSHELRTPLNGIIGMATLLGREPLSKGQESNLNNILSSSRLLLLVINEILDFSKIEAGQLKLEKIPFNFKNVYKEIFSIFENHTSEKQLDFSCYIDPDIPDSLIGDPVRLQQLMNNFCSNALKFTKQGGISISLLVTEQTADLVNIRCLVSDTGIGIEKDKQDKLFKAFKQEDDSTTREYGGTGLGLYISKQIIEKMGGEVIFKSEKNKGSTFGFNCQFKKTQEIPSEVINEKNVSKNTLQGLTILVVDDNLINVEVAKSLLEDLLADVEVAYGGQESIEKAKQCKFDVILMDIQMPNMDGVEAMRHISELPMKESCFKVALTANVMEKDVKRYLQSGFDDVVAKPFKVNELAEKILEHSSKSTS
jgi:signal transduction histidine kinase/ActR/RegA family two-component response regulator